LLAVVLAFAASLSWGAADFTGGLKSRTIPTALVLLVMESVGLLLVIAYLAVRLEALPPGGAVAASLGAGVAAVTGLFSFYRGLAIGTMSVVAPISACGVAIPVLVGILGGDALSTLTALGMAVAVAGVVLASREGPTEADSERSPNRLSILLALIAAVSFGTFFTFSDIAAQHSVPWLLFFARAASVPVLIAWVVRARPGVPRRGDALPLVLAGTLDVTATALYGVALREGALSVVSVVGSLYPVVTVILARVLLAERIHGLQAAGVLAAFTGVLLIVAGR
jgi:drug/metabolite transporter (DMT)-like permease